MPLKLAPQDKCLHLRRTTPFPQMVGCPVDLVNGWILAALGLSSRKKMTRRTKFSQGRNVPPLVLPVLHFADNQRNVTLWVSLTGQGLCLWEGEKGCSGDSVRMVQQPKDRAIREGITYILCSLWPDSKVKGTCQIL